MPFFTIKFVPKDYDESMRFIERALEAGFRDVADAFDSANWNTGAHITMNQDRIKQIVSAMGANFTDVTQVKNSDGYICRPCYETGDYCPSYSLMRDPYGNDVCREYWDDHYCSCHNCGTMLYQDDACITEDEYETHYRCEECHETNAFRGVQYFTGPRKEYDGTNSFGSSRSFGIEIETQGGRCREDLSFDGKSDGSTQGTEFVSHKLRGDAGLEQLKLLIESGKHIDYDEDCGVHVHVNCRDLTDKQVHSVFAAYVVSLTYWSRTIEEDRFGGTYAHGTDVDAYMMARDGCYNGNNFGHSFSGADRYQWINPSAFATHSTLENRLHHASWDYYELSRWIIRNVRFVRIMKYWAPLPTESESAFRRRIQPALAWVDSNNNTNLPKPADTVSAEPQTSADRTIWDGIRSSSDSNREIARDVDRLLPRIPT